MVATLERLDVITDDRPELSTTDGTGTGKYAHFVLDETIVDASVFGTPLRAICGWTFVPTRDPQKFPVCPECQRLYDLGLDGRLREWAQRDQGE